MDNGRFPDGSCENCLSLMHGLYDCPFMEEPETQRCRVRAHAESIKERGVSPRARRYYKRQQSRAMRRAARMDPEGAPERRLIRGWFW